MTPLQLALPASIPHDSSVTISYSDFMYTSTLSTELCVLSYMSKWFSANKLGLRLDTTRQ